MSSANVKSIDALSEMRGSLAQFRAEAQSALDSAAMEIQRTQAWLQERLQHWGNVVRRCEAAVRQGQAALTRCQNSGYYDRDGHYHPPNCSAQEAALYQAQRQLAEAQPELQKVQQAKRAVNEAVAAYQREAQRLAGLLSNDLPKAAALLERKISILDGYVGMSVPMNAGGLGNSVSTVTDSGMAFTALDASTNAQYDKAADSICINSKLQAADLGLLSPLVAHEQIHRKYKSDDPHDESSLQNYIAEEKEAYQAQVDEWRRVREQFFQRYPTTDSRATMSEDARNLLSDLQQLDQEIQERGWDDFLQRRASTWRTRMESANGKS